MTSWLDAEVSTTGGAQLNPERVAGAVSTDGEVSVRTTESISKNPKNGSDCPWRRYLQRELICELRPESIEVDTVSYTPITGAKSLDATTTGVNGRADEDYAR